MLNVEKYIEKLLLKHDCVIIPGLGGFVSHYESPYLESENALFYPPTRTIGFNAQLDMNDGLLVSAYMQAYDTNFPEASRMVQHEVDRIKEALHKSGSYTFDNLGLLEQESDNRLLFTPQNDGGIASPDLYGLDAFKVEPYLEPHKEDEVKENVLQSVERSMKENKEKKVHTSHYIIRINKSITHCAAAALLAFIFYFFMTVPTANSLQREACTLSISNGALYDFPVQDIQQENKTVDIKPVKTETTKKEKNITVQPVQKKTVEKVSTLSSIPAQASAEKEQLYYTIVLASSISKANAQNYIHELHQQKYDLAQIYVNKKMVRIVYSKYPSQEEAQKVLNRLHDRDGFQDAWILQVKQS